MHNKVKKSRALTIYDYPQTTSNSVRVLSPPLDRPALRAPITLPAYAQGEHHFISSKLKITIEITRFPPRIHLCRSSVSTPPPALGREGLVRHAGDCRHGQHHHHHYHHHCCHEHSPTGPGSCRSCQTCRWPSSLCSASSSSFQSPPSTTWWSSKPGTSWTPTTTTRGTSSQRGSATCQSQERQFSRRSEM